MTQPIKNVTLRFPCGEDWNKMDTSSGERICGRCQHKVVDFTNMSDEEFQEHLKRSQHVCGRFKRSQLSANFLKYAAATAIAAINVSATACDTGSVTSTASTTEVNEIVTDLPYLGVMSPPAFQYVKIGNDTIALPFQR